MNSKVFEKFNSQNQHPNSKSSTTVSQGKDQKIEYPLEHLLFGSLNLNYGSTK